ncbi:MAG: alpha/beta hydrolase [Myxococcota bacterium]
MTRMIVALTLMGCAEDTDWVPPHATEAKVLHLENGGYGPVAHRYEGEGPAVVLLHGISSNHHFWDLTPERSLALALREAGYDVWNVDLRGHGAARRTAAGKHQQGAGSIDEYGRTDLRQVLSAVVAERGDEVPIHLVGHSMGGMVLVAYLADDGEIPLTSAVVVGTPLDFVDVDKLMHTASRASRAFSGVPLRTPFFAGLATGKDKVHFEHLLSLLYNTDNMEDPAEALMLQRIVSPLWRGELKHLAEIGRRRAYGPRGSDRAYDQELGTVDLPVLAMAGRMDRVAPPDRVSGFERAMPGAELLVVSRSNGFSADYGHLDLGLGDAAAEEIYPRIVDWIGSHP